MPFLQTTIQDLLIYQPNVYKDERGYFLETYNQQAFLKEGIKYSFVQDNQSFSCYGVIRGLHYQTGQYAQTKLVRVLQGKILDVAVDIRPHSPTFKKSFSLELSAENKLQLLVPRGFAHGFSVLSETAEIFYKCDNLYNKESEAGIAFNDPQLQIDWNLPSNSVLVSAKDLQLPNFDKAIIA